MTVSEWALFCLAAFGFAWLEEPLAQDLDEAVRLWLYIKERTG